MEMVMEMVAANTSLYIIMNSNDHPYHTLGEPCESSHGIYMVAHNGRYPFGVRHHFSVYTQGHFYHLSAPTLPVRLLGQRSNTLTGPPVPPQLVHQDFSSHDTEDYVRVLNSPRKKAFEAYQLGQTDYSPEQILRIAEWIIQHMPHYRLFTANCQHFALELLYRIVERFGNRSSFVGTVNQIADWDLRSNQQEHINSIENGFLISPPRPSK